MTGLDKRSYQQIVELLTPLMSSEADRRALIVLTFVDHPLIERIDFTGATSAFLPHLIDTLHQFGKLEDGRPALWAVLEVAREQVGLDQKHRIDALRPSFDLPPPPRLDKLFVSYSRRNEIFARKLVGDLKDAGLRVWYDREKIKGGEDWWQSIVNGIKAADYFVFCLSPDAIRSEVARDELLAARQHGKPIFAVMLENCLDDLQTEMFANIQWLSKLHVIDFTQIAQYGSNLSELIESLPGYTPPDLYFLEEIDPRDLPNPFRGLEAFLEVDAAYFTGRDDAVADLIERIQDPQKPRLLAVVGASGSGKSSLVRAGLIPSIRQQLPFWDTITIRPGSNPIDELADRLQERLGVDASGTRNRLRTESNALDDIASELLQGKPEDARFVLVIDQFEEVFTLTSSEEQDIFLQRLLTSILKPNGKIYVILTLRADFFDRLSTVPELAKLVRDNLDIATEMTPDQLRRSIEDPAQKVGVVYEEGLVETVLEDVRAQPGSLPLLQYALKELFERKVGRRMTYEAYEQIGGVKGALASRAESLFSKMSADQQEALRKILLRLVEVGDETITRRRTAVSDLHFVGVADRTVEATLDQLTGQETRLLVASTPLVQDGTSSEDEIYYEVSHEALLTHWSRVANWIDDNREDLRRSSEILALAKAWDDTTRADNSFLLRGARLANAREWLQRGDPTALQREFVEASITFDETEKERELALQRRALNRARLLAGSFAVFLLVAIGLTLFAFDQQATAEDNAATSVANEATSVAAVATSQARGTEAVSQRDLAEAQRDLAEAQRLLVQARALSLEDAGNVETALLVGLAAHQRIDTEASLSVLRDIVPRLHTTQRLPDILPASDDDLLDQITADTSEYIESADQWVVATETTVYLIDAATGRQINSHDLHGDASIVAVDADSERVTSIDEEGTLIVWSPDEGLVYRRTYSRLTQTNTIPVSLVLSGDLLAIVDGNIRLINLGEPRELPNLSDLDRIAYVAMSPDGSYLGAVTNAMLESTNPSDNLFSTDNIATGDNLFQQDELFLVNLDTGEQQRFELDFITFAAPIFSPDSDLIAVPLLDGIHLFSVTNSAEQVPIQVIRFADEWVTALDFSADGSLLAAVHFGLDSLTTHIRLWDVNDGSQVRVLTGPEDTLNLGFRDVEDRLSSWQADGSLRHWWTREMPREDGRVITDNSYANRSLFIGLPGDHLMLSIDLSPLIESDEPVQLQQAGIVDIETNRLVSEISLDSAIDRAIFTEDGKWIFTLEGDSQLYELSGEGERRLYNLEGDESDSVQRLYLVDDRLIVTRYSGHQQIYAHPSGDVLFSIDASRYLRELPYVQRDMKRIFFYAERGRLEVFDLDTGENVATYEQSECRNVEAYHDPYLVTENAVGDGLCVWDTRDNTLLTSTALSSRPEEYESIHDNAGWLSFIYLEDRTLHVERWHSDHTATNYKKDIETDDEGRVRIFKISSDFVVLAMNSDTTSLQVFQLDDGSFVRELQTSSLAPFLDPDDDNVFVGGSVFDTDLTSNYVSRLSFGVSRAGLINLATGEERTLDTLSRGELDGENAGFSLVLFYFTPEQTYGLTHTLNTNTIASMTEALERSSIVAQLWIMDYPRYACQRLVRSLSTEERERYDVPDNLQPCTASS